MTRCPKCRSIDTTKRPFREFGDLREMICLNCGTCFEGRKGPSRD